MVRDTSISSKILTVVIHATFVLVVAITLLPILHVFAVSFSSGKAYSGGIGIVPKDFTLSAYDIIMKAGTVPNALVNSIIYMVSGTALNIALTSMMAFALSRKRLAFRTAYTIFVLIPMFFSGGMIPSFILIKNLGLYNTIGAMILPGAISVWNLIIMRTFFLSVPNDLDESALMDGANNFTIFIRIILPVSSASIATIALFYAVGHWNSWFGAMIYLRDMEKYPLQLVLRNIVIQGQMEREFVAARDYAAAEGMSQVNDESIKYATLVVSILPMLFIYPFLQRYFVKGVLIGSLKG